MSRSTMPDRTMPDRTMPDRSMEERSSIRGREVALGVAVCAALPYLLMKLLWLSGSDVGTSAGVDTTHLHGMRDQIGNAITAVMDILAILLAIGLTRVGSRRSLIPGWVVLILGSGAMGLLVPIAIGLPVGAVLQASLSGTLSSGHEGNLQPWVFAVAYGGFIVLGITLGYLLVQYILRRWARLWIVAPGPGPVWARIVGGLGMLPYGIAMLLWGVLGPGSTGPRAMDVVEQRAVLVVTGVLALLGYLAPMIARRGLPRHVQLLWAATWIGCSSTAFQAIAQILLARDGQPRLLVLALGLIAAPAAGAYGLAILRDRLRGRDRC